MRERVPGYGEPMLKRTLLLLAALLVLPHAAHADEVPLTNADVVRMTAAGLSAETIITKIRASRSDFRTDTDSLVALAAEHVHDAVIREMINRGAAGSQPAEPKANGELRARRSTSGARRKRFDEVSVGYCDHAQLELTTTGLKTTGCHETDVDLAWTDIESVCYVFGFRGTMAIRTSAGQEKRISTTTPAEMKSVRDSVRSRSAKTRETTGCR